MNKCIQKEESGGIAWKLAQHDSLALANRGDYSLKILAGKMESLTMLVGEVRPKVRCFSIFLPPKEKGYNTVLDKMSVSTKERVFRPRGGTSLEIALPLKYKAGM